MLPAELPLYFCGIPFRAYQVGRKLRWLLARGEIRQVMRGVYVDIRVPDSPRSELTHCASSYRRTLSCGGEPPPGCTGSTRRR
ncbi:hypothetical protein ACIBG5_21055 [Kribbella sp. NPDC050241]|uniref:hypothetical protein n=1 Tax=Kribbella sp. NPDC050241 TaxID=3364115 RepID=UPI003792E475